MTQKTVQLEAMEHMLDLVRAVKAVEGVYKTTSVAKYTVKLPDDSYRQINIDRGQEFLFSGARLSKNEKNIIFEFEPVDAQSYKQMELDHRKVFQTFPELEAITVRVVTGSEAEASFDAVLKQGLADFGDKIQDGRDQAALAKQEANEAAYEDNSAWGEF